MSDAGELPEPFHLPSSRCALSSRLRWGVGIALPFNHLVVVVQDIVVLFLSKAEVVVVNSSLSVSLCPRGTRGRGLVC